MTAASSRPSRRPSSATTCASWWRAARAAARIAGSGRASTGSARASGRTWSSATCTPRRPSACHVGYTEGHTPVWIESDAVLVNTVKIDVLETAHPEDIGLGGHVTLPMGRDARAKDMTDSAG